MYVSRWLTKPLIAEPTIIRTVLEYVNARQEGKVSELVLPENEPKSTNASSYEGVGVLEVSGTLIPRTNMEAMCGDFISVQDLKNDFQALEQEYETILLYVDSGGGTMTGVPEFAEMIRNSKSRVVGFTDTIAASGGYWILSAADEVVATPSAQVGSIGVYIPIKKDETKFDTTTYFSAGERKLYGASDIPMSDKEKEYFTQRVEKAYEWFTSAVATYRNVSQEEIKGTQADVFTAKDVKGLLVDRIVNNIMEV